MKRILENDPMCPMCDKNVPAMSVTISSNAEAEFKALVELMKDSTNQEEETQEGDNEDEDGEQF